MGANCHNKVFNLLCTSKPRKYILRIIIYLIAIVAILLLLSKYDTIPELRHYYQAEHLLSNRGGSPIQANLSVYDNKGFTSTMKPPREYTTGKSKYYNHTYNFSLPIIVVDSTKTPSASAPIYSNHERSIADILGTELYEELSNYCSTNGIDIDNYNNYGELFYFCHLNNAPMVHKLKQKITHQGSSIYILATNDFSLSKLDGVKDYRHYPGGMDSISEINKKCLKPNGYKNMQDGFVLKLKVNDHVSGANQVVPQNTFVGLFRKAILLEDISQAYYNIEVYSKSIKDISAKMEFNSAVDCKMESKWNDPLEIGMSSIHLSNRYKIVPPAVSVFVKARIHVAFNDMKNIQDMRLIVLSAIISILFAGLAQNLIKLLRLIPFCKIFKKSRYHLCKK